MTHAEHWAAVKALVGQALDLEPGARMAWLAEQDVPEQVRTEARELVERDARADGFLETPVLQHAGSAEALLAATAPHAQPVVSPGQQIGAYQVVRQLGEGGMGTVYLATRSDAAFDKLVAIKVARAGLHHASLAERLEQERRLLATLDHPNIARLIDGGTTTDGLPYAVMEYVDGVPIDEYCRTHALTLEQRLALVRTVCDAVHHAHRNLIVHRDIKTGNVLVTAQGTPKLLDFGIAKLLDADTVMQTMTGFGAMTPESASPEQVVGGAITVATDVYGIGVLAYRLLTDRGPFAAATNPAALVKAICEAEPEAPSRVAPSRRIPRDVDSIVRKALRKRPNDRYDSASALAADIDRFLEGRPVSAAPDSFRYRAGRFVSRHRLVVSLASAAVVLALAGVGAIVWQARVAHHEREIAERRFSELRSLANTLIFRIHDEVSPLPGSTPVRKTIVASALTYLDSLAKDAGDDASLKRELASAYVRLAYVQGLGATSNLGDAVGAKASLDRALALATAIVESPSVTADDFIGLARIHELIGQAAEGPKERIASVEEALRVLDRVAEADASSTAITGLRAGLEWNLGVASAKMGDFAGSATHYGQAAALYERNFRAAAPDRWKDASRNYSLALKNLGAAQWQTGDRQTAVASYKKALAIDEERLATQPDNTTWLLDVSFSVASLAHAEFNTGHVDEAVAHYTRALELRKRSLAGDPANAQARGAVERGHRTLARALAVQGNAAGAIEALREADAVAAARQTRTTARDARGVALDRAMAEIAVYRELIEHDATNAAKHGATACRVLDHVADLMAADAAEGIPARGLTPDYFAEMRALCTAAQNPSR